jgi:hypothetical protein
VRSLKLPTTKTSAVMPPGGVAMLPPSPSIGRFWTRGRTICADSCPLTHTGTIAGSPRTFWSPSSFIRAITQSIVCSSAGVPLKRFPNLSVISASRFHAVLSFSAASMMRSASAR